MKYLLNFYKKRRFIANKMQLLSICSNQLDVFEKKLSEKHFYTKSDYARSKEILLKEISKQLSSEYDFIASLDEKLDNFTEIGVSYISNVSFEFFDFCKFRMHGDYYIDRRCSPFMSGLHFIALQWGFDHGFVTKEEMEEDRLAYLDALRQIT